MNTNSLAGTEDSHVAALLIAAAEALLEASKSDLPREFVDGLFALAVPEDLVRYDAREVAALAEASWSFLSERCPGGTESAVGVRPPELENG